MKKFLSIEIMMNWFVAAGVWAQDDFRDVKSPVGIPFQWGWLILIFVLLIVGAIVWWLFNRPDTKPGPPPPPPLSPWELALQRLKQLEEKNYLSLGKFQDYFFELSDILRHYIEDRYDIDAPERTTEEFLISMRVMDVLTGAQKNTLQNFLVECDKVKFAKYAPSIDDAHWAFGIAKSFIEQTTVIPTQRLGE